MSIFLFVLFWLTNSEEITSQVGTVAPDGPKDDPAVLKTLTGGMTKENIQWTHNYTLSGDIISATLEIDIIDAEETLDLYAGTDSSGIFFGAAEGIQQDNMGWLDLTGPPYASINNVIEIPPALFGDLADGRFDVYGLNNGLGSYGCNRALLTIVVIEI
jgi:hypothetical protein